MTTMHKITFGIRLQIVAHLLEKADIMCKSIAVNNRTNESFLVHLQNQPNSESLIYLLFSIKVNLWRIR